jgi:hypothetical protein
VHRIAHLVDVLPARALRADGVELALVLARVAGGVVMQGWHHRSPANG